MGLLKSGRGVARRPDKYAESLRQSGALDADQPDNLSSAGFSDMFSKSALMEYATSPRFRSLLILEPRMELSEPTAGGDVVNLWISGMIENGLTLMRTGGQLPDRPPAGNWTC